LKTLTLAAGEKMKEQDLKLAMPDGAAEAVLYTSDDGKPLPGVLFVPDIGSIRDTMRKMAQRLAEEGYTVLMPNPFYRTSAVPVFSFPRKPGDPATMKRMGELISPLTPEALDADLEVYLDFLTSQPTTAPGGVGVVGFCIGGLITFRAAAVRPEKVAVAASFHGGGLYKANDAASPHLGLPKVKARLYFGHAVEDNSMNAEAITELVKALKAWGGRYESEMYEGARHGWTVPDNPAYNQPQAERAWAKLTALFKESLR
jgi:carboxymethylenebutenolidase